VSYSMADKIEQSKNFDIYEPAGDVLVFAPDDLELNWGTDPMPPPRAIYKRDPDTVSDDESGVTSDWNFVSSN